MSIVYGVYVYLSLGFELFSLRPFFDQQHAKYIYIQHQCTALVDPSNALHVLSKVKMHHRNSCCTESIRDIYHFDRKTDLEWEAQFADCERSDGKPLNDRSENDDLEVKASFSLRSLRGLPIQKTCVWMDGAPIFTQI